MAAGKRIPNPNGRPKGTPNKLTAFTRQWIADLLAGETDKIRTELSSLTGEKYLRVIVDLIAYAVPRPAAEAPPADEATKQYTVTFHA